MKIDYETPPPLWSLRVDDGQILALAAVEPYTRKTDGAASYLLTWEGLCVDCGEPYRFTTGMKSNAVVRRCDQHKHTPGKTPLPEGMRYRSREWKAWQRGKINY